MENNELCLEKLKKDYSIIQKKYSLPSFEELNMDFGIEKAADSETDYLIREVRKFMSDKLSNYLRFIERLLQPSNVPIFVFSIIKTLGVEEKNKLSEIYKKLAKVEVSLICLDLEFDEKKEAEFVINTFGFWQEIKKDLIEIIECIKCRWDSKSESNNKGYFG